MEPLARDDSVDRPRAGSLVLTRGEVADLLSTDACIACAAPTRWRCWAANHALGRAVETYEQEQGRVGIVTRDRWIEP